MVWGLGAVTVYVSVRVMLQLEVIYTLLASQTQTHIHAYT